MENNPPNFDSPERLRDSSFPFQDSSPFIPHAPHPYQSPLHESYTMQDPRFRPAPPSYATQSHRQVHYQYPHQQTQHQQTQHQQMQHQQMQHQQMQHQQTQRPMFRASAQFDGNSYVEQVHPWLGQMAYEQSQQEFRQENNPRPLLNATSSPLNPSNVATANVETGPVKTKLKMNWSAEEDVHLTCAWIGVTEDPINGTDQKGSVFWEKIAQVFNDKKGDKKRPVSACTDRWNRTISKACQKFTGFYLKAKKDLGSGTNHEDWVKQAKKVYAEVLTKEANDAKIAKNDGDPRPAAVVSFKWDECWALLRQHPKFAEECDGSAPFDDPKIRPTGTKRAREQERAKEQGNNPAGKTSGISAAANQMAKASKKRTRHLEEMVENDIMSINFEGLSERAKEFYNIQQERILMKARAKAARPPSSPSEGEEY